MDKAVASAFSNAAGRYDAYAEQQRHVCERLLALAQPHMHPGGRWVDVGCGTGYLARLIREQSVPVEVMGVDAAEGMCRKAAGQGQNVLAADMVALPLADASVDGICSSLALQWTDAPADAFAEWARVLKPGGAIACSTFTEGTLNELASAYHTLDIAPPLRPFLPYTRIIEMINCAGLALLLNESTALIRKDNYLLSLLKYIKSIGANTSSSSKGLRTKRHFERLEEVYPMQAGGVVSTWQVGYFVATKPL